MFDISLERINDEFGFLTFPGGGRIRPPDQTLQSPVKGSSSTSGGLNPTPNLPTNRTLVAG